MRSFADDLLARMGSGDVNGVLLLNGDEVLIISGSELGWRGVVLGPATKGRLHGYNINLTIRSNGQLYRPSDYNSRTFDYDSRTLVRWFWHVNIELPVTQALVRLRLMEDLARVASPTLRSRFAALRPAWPVDPHAGPSAPLRASDMERLLREGD